MEKKEPFWNTGDHPILGYYYTGNTLWNKAFHKRKTSSLNGFEINNALNKYR